MGRKNDKFELSGINHLALVCKDMARTVDFYTNVLGMPLVKTIDLPMGMGQHFFFDCGGGDCVAFFWFPNAPQAAPGVSSAAALPGKGDLATAHGSMNHVAFNVPVEKFDDYVLKLQAAGVAVSDVSNHDDSEWTVSKTLHEGVYIRSVYFFDPDGILLEFACWTRPLGEQDNLVVPATAISAQTT
ncbi:MAG: VOC family protein [Actinobacteria bacterium]|nr:VOC family protein [Actinomycetota bacterium]